MIALLLVVGLVVADQLTKVWAVRYLQPVHSIVLTDFFRLTYVENRGAAFGIFYGAIWFLVVITVLILGAITMYYRKLPQGKPYLFVRLALLLIAGGAIGNFIDRVRIGFVVDMFHVTFINFPVFNVADVFIVVGSILFAVLTLVIKEGHDA